MSNNVVKSNLTERSVKTCPVYQYDYGMELHVVGVELPPVFEVHFCNAGDGETKTAIGTDGVVMIPDEYLQTGSNVLAYIYLHTGTDDGETVYKIEIPVRHRAEPTDQEPTPEEQSVITQTIALLNEAVEDVSAIAEAIPTTINTALQEAKDSGEFDGRDGIDGQDGQDGYTPIKGVDYFDGATGATGATGADGYSPTVATSEITGGHSVTITDAEGAHSFNVMDGEDGDDYVLTSTDKQDIADIVVNQVIPKADIIKDTTSGSICSFPDGADDVPMDSLKVKIEPVQDLHGQDAPYPAGGGKNLAIISENSYSEHQRATWIYNNQGGVEITASGTYARVAYLFNVIEGNTYTLSFKAASNGNYHLVYINSSEEWKTKYGTVNVSSNQLSSYSITFTAISNVLFVGFYVTSSDTTGTMTVQDFQLELGSTATSYAPYSNICPITGFTEAKVTACGKNLLNPGTNDSINGITKTVNADGSITFSGTATGTTDFYFNGTTSSGTVLGIPEGRYHCLGSENGSTQTYRFFCIYVKNGTTYYANGADHTAITIDRTTAVRLFFRVYNGATVNITERLAFYAGSHQSNEQWQPYKTKLATNPLPISWQSEAGTVYSGELNVTTGELVVDRASVSIDGTTGSWYSRSGTTNPVYYVTASSLNLSIKATTWVECKSNQYKIDANNNGYNGSSIGLSSVNNQNLFFCSNAQTLSDFRTALSTTPIVVVYPIEPITYTLTPHEVKTLLGTNNIFADTGDCEVSYSCDTKLYIDKKIAEIVNQSTAQTLSSPRLQTMNVMPTLNLEPNDEPNETEVTDSEPIE